MDNEQAAITRIQEASKMSWQVYQKPLVVTTSGGKDRSVCAALAERAGIPFEVLHSHTTADTPETVYFIREEFRRLELNGVKCINSKLSFLQGRAHVNVEADTAKTHAPNAACAVLLFRIERVRRRGPFYYNRRPVGGIFQQTENRGIYEAGRELILNNDNDDVETRNKCSNPHE